MAELYEFDPAQDLQVLETFTFEEEVERPATMRFYTLDDQVTDYFERRIPIGKVSRYQLQLLQKDADRVRDLYDEIVIGTDTAYEARVQRPRDKILPWITPVYAEPLTRRPMSWEADYKPLFVPRQPRYYDRLLAGLPRPYSFGEGRHTVFPSIQRIVNFEGKDAVNVLPVYNRTRGILHAGGQYEIVEEPVPNTQDDVGTRGYWIQKRPLDIISPMAEHPILGTNDPHFYETQADYTDIVPSVEAVLNHAVPVTPHPYRDATPYLKIYDIKWSDIPWSVWRRHFPPADPVETGLPVEPITLQPHEADIPGESLQKHYNLPYRPGLAPRFWLARQEDGGGLIAKLLLSQAGEMTPISLPNPSEMPEPPSIPATPADCLPDGISFENLLTAGVYRPPGICVPPEVIAKERAELGMRNRIPWGETTQTDILTSYLPILMAAQGPAPDVPKEPVLPRIDVPPISPLREEVLAILADQKRTPEDKASDLRILVNDMPIRNKQFLDNDEKFLLCEHSLAMLAGDLGRNNRDFYDTWCAIVEGSRVCKYCGEAINRDVFSNTTEFDDEGHAVVHSEAAMVAEFHPGAVRTFTEGLQALRPLFDTRDPAQDAFFLLLSILQILPDQAFLEPVLGQVRQLSAFTKSKGDSAQAVFGICGVVLLMLIHDPFLIPRRSFGGPFLISGWPREGKEGDHGILDSILRALKMTFEQFRSSFKGPSMGLLREVFRDTKKVRDKCVVALKVMTRPPDSFIKKLNLTDYTDRLEQAALRYAKAPPVPAELTGLVPNIRIDSTEPAKRSATECVPATGTSYWSTDTPPKYGQQPVPFSRTTLPGPSAHRVTPMESSRVGWDGVPAATASRLSKAIPAFIKGLRGIPLARALEDRSISWFRASSIATRLLDMATGVPPALLRQLRGELESLNPTANVSQLRDAARGISYALVDAVAGIPALREKWVETLPKDIALKAILRQKDEIDGEVRVLVTAERETFKNRLGEKSDMERELIKQLLDIGLAPYIITLKDRVLFAEQLEERVRPADPLGNPEVPEEGFQQVPTDAEQNDADQGERGDFGDMPNRPYEGDDVYGSADPDIGV